MSQTAAFIMPVKIKGNELELRFFRDAVESIKRQTDTDWIIIMVDDFTDDQKVYDVIDEMKADLKDKLHVIYSEKNEGAGKSRNKGVRYASGIGAPFIFSMIRTISPTRKDLNWSEKRLVTTRLTLYIRALM